MGTQMMVTQGQRIARFSGRILSHVVPTEVLGRLNMGSKERIPKNMSDTIVFRRWLPPGATPSNPNQYKVTPTTYLLSEGETPNSRTLIAQDIVATLQQYGVLYRYTDRVADLHEDNIPEHMVKRVGEEMGLLLEMVRYGILKAGTNVYRAGNVGSRSSITALMSGNLFALVGRQLEANRAKPMTKILAPSQNVGTSSIEAAYVVVSHSDLGQDMRNVLPNFVHVSDYGSRTPIHPNELGSWQQFRFVTSPELFPYVNAGGTTAANTRLAGGVPNGAGDAVDVYPMLVMAEDAFGDVMLRGREAIRPYHKRPDEDSKEDPLGQRGHVGAKAYFTAVRLNEQHMAVVEVACSSLNV